MTDNSHLDIFPNYSGNQKFSRQRSVESARAMGRYASEWAAATLDKAIPDGLARHQRADLEFLLGLGRSPSLNLHASNVPARRELNGHCITSMLGAWQDTTGREMQLLTITPDDWHISENQPELRIKARRAEAARWLIKLGFTGLGVMEIQPYLNHPAAIEGRVISAHLHFIGFPDDPYTFGKRVAEFNKANAGRCSIGAFAVARAIKLTETDVASVAYYIFEPLHWAKRLTSSRVDEGKLKHRKAALPQHLALRSAEIMSYMRVTDLIITRGTAAWHWRHQLLQSVEMGSPDAMLDVHQLNYLWRAVWKALPDRGYHRVTLR